MTYEISTHGNGNKAEIIAHLKELTRKIENMDIKKSLTFNTRTCNDGIETMIDAHSFGLK